MSWEEFDIFCADCDAQLEYISPDGCSKCGSHYVIMLPSTLEQPKGKTPKLRKPSRDEWLSVINI